MIAPAKRDMERELHALRDGDLDLGAFVRETQPQWDALAAKLVSRWELPPGIDAEDARQEMLLALLEQRGLERWDPARQVKLSRYVVWNSATHAKAWLHKQRGAVRHRGTSKSRFPLACSSLTQGDDGREDPVMRAMDDGDTPEREAEQREVQEVVRAMVAAMPTRRARTALEVLLRVGGEPEAAARAIGSDADLALDCRVGSEREARAAVAEAIGIAREMFAR